MLKFIITALLIFSCSLKNESTKEKALVTFKIDRQSSRLMENGITEPTISGDLNCFMVAMDYPIESSGNICYDSGSSFKLEADDVAGTFSANSNNEFTVDAGENIEFHLIGWSSDIACPASSAVNGNVDLSNAYYLGSTYDSILAGVNNSVTLNGTFNLGDSLSNCTGSIFNLTTPGDPYNTVITNDNPVSYWRLDDLSDEQGANGLSNGSTVSFSGSAGVSGDLSGYGIFDGTTNNFLEVSSPSGSIQFTGAAFSIEAWVYITSFASNNYIVSMDSSNSHTYRLKVDTGGYPIFYMNDVSNSLTATASSPISLNTWYHLVGTHHGSGVTDIFVNGGSPAGSASGTEPTPTWISPNLRIGGNAVPIEFSGRIDEVALYSSPLVTVSVQAHYNAASAPLLFTDPIKRRYIPRRQRHQ